MCLPLSARQVLGSFWIKIFHGPPRLKLPTIPILAVIPTMSNSRDGHGGENGPKICSGTSHVFTLWVQDSPACPKHKNHLSSCVSSLLAAFSEARETWIRSMIQRSLFQSLVERRGVDGGGKEGPGYAEPAGGTQSFRVPNLMSQKAAFPRGVSPSVNESGD